MFIKSEMRKGKMSVVMFFLMTFFFSLSHASGVPKDIAVHTNVVNEKPESTKRTRTLHVRGDYNYPPYEYLDDHGKPLGFNVDIINAVADAMGLKVEIDLGPWEEVMLQLEEGKIDALIGMFNTSERDKLFDFSIPHFIASYAVFVRDGSPIQSLDDARTTKIIVQLRDLGHDYLLENAITQDIIIKKDWSDVLTSLSKGEGDCAIVSRLQGTQLIGNLPLSNIRAVGPPIIQSKYSIAVTQDSSALLAQINEGLSIIKKTGKYDQIYKKWFGIYNEQPLTFVKAFKYFFWIILPLIAFAITVLLWSWTLRQRVNLRTNDLNTELFEHRQTEEVLRRRESQLQQIFEILPIGLWFADKDGNLQRGNPMGLQIRGVEPHIPISEYGALRGCRLPSREPIEPDDWALMKTVREGVTIINELLEIESFDGKKKTILNYTAPVLDDNGNVDGAIVVNLDISDRVALENQLRQSQKMESIGNLAGGIAHDFNNILASVLGFSEIALDEVEKGSTIEDNLQEIYTSGLRAKEIVNQILAFARQSDEEKKPTRIDCIIIEALKLIRPSTPSSIEIRKELESSSLVMGNATQIHQVIMNLCTNAAYAMQDNGGIMELTLKDVHFRENTNIPGGLEKGKYIELAISDNGSGIEPEHIDSIFDPYFTTKEIGKGTGMGLAMVRGIVASYGGTISVESSPSVKTIFTIYLPITSSLDNKSTFETKTLPKGDEHILFVDDEPPIARMGSRILESLGYKVTTRTSSIEALELFKAKPDDFQLVITDMTMPHMTGDKFTIELKQVRADIPIILCTGYSSKINAEIAQEIGINAFSYKPFTKADLASTVREVLDKA